MNYLKSFVGIACLLIITSANADDLLKKTVDISDIDSVELHGPGLLTISQDGEEKLQIIAAEKVMKRIDISAHGKTLRMRFKQGGGWQLFNFDNDIHYQLSVKNLNRINVLGSANVELATAINTQEFELERSGSGNVNFRDIIATELNIQTAGSGNVSAKRIDVAKMEVNAAGSGNYSIDSIEAKEEVEFETAGSGNVTVNQLNTAKLRINGAGSGNFVIGKGEVEHQKIDIAGSGDYRAQLFKSKSADINVSGASDAVVWVTETLEADASGASDIHYYGEPNSTNFDTSGASDVKSLGRSPN